MNLGPSRRFAWVSALDRHSAKDLLRLQKDMRQWYSGREDYYSTIDFTRDNWISDPAYRWIRKASEGVLNVLEIGCGRANILLQERSLPSRYTGVDFSSELIKSNSERFSGATFELLQSPFKLDFASETFDLVISIFVLEHCVFPHLALDEWARVLKKGGRLIILSPIFSGKALFPRRDWAFRRVPVARSLRAAKFSTLL